MNKKLAEKLRWFTKTQGIAGKGSLSVVLVLTRKAMAATFPLNPEEYVTSGGGQVAGLGGGAIQRILKDHGIDRVLATEGGRTSRGSLDTMRSYVRFLNEMHDYGCVDLEGIENWWIDQVKKFFRGRPLKVKMDPAKSLRTLVRDFIDQAFQRQKEVPGTMVAGAVMQHLVGAKLEVSTCGLSIDHSGFSVADEPGGRKGDFLVGSTAIHVTTAPTERLVAKCEANLNEGLQPLIITTETGVGGAEALAKNSGLGERIEILEIGQFVTTNICELSQFSAAQRPSVIRDIFRKYNEIVEECETDPSLKVLVG